MTIPSRHFAAVSRPHRGSLARYGVAGSLVLWIIALAGTPFYLIGALATGAVFSLIDSVRRRIKRWRRPTRRGAPEAEGWVSLLARIVGTADSALRPFIRRHADQVVISLPRLGTFTRDAATPSIGARHLLERLAAALEAGAWRIDVIGYDDGRRDNAATGERAGHAALNLSARRARAAREALRDAGCRQPIAALGAPFPSEAGAPGAAPPGSGEPAGIEIVIRKAPHEAPHAA